MLNLANTEDKHSDSNAAAPFYQRGNMRSLVWPMPEQEFLSQYWEKKPLVLKRKDRSFYGDLFTLRDFDRYLRLGQGYVKTAEATANKTNKHPGTGPQAMEKILSDMHNGHTLILDNVQAFHPNLGLFCRTLGQEIGMRFQTNLYLTPPSGKGFTPHWDEHDVFVLQVMGSKYWKVEAQQRELPLKGASMTDGREFRGEVMEFTLEQGDMVYIPRGFVHAAECGPESSLHVTMGAQVCTWDEFANAVLKAAMLRDPKLRLALPIGFMTGHDETIVRQTQNIFNKISNPAFLADVLNQYRDELVQQAPLDISGEVVSFFDPKTVTLDEKLQVRAGLVHQLRDSADTITLKVGTRAITFPSLFAPALRFSLSERTFKARDLPGDIDNDERLAFVERMMQEAVIVRA